MVAFLIEFGALVLLLSLLGRLAGRWGLSAIPFYLVGGLCFGTGGFLPLADIEEFTEIGATLGTILLLLMLGLEYTQSELLAGLRRDSRAGLVDIVLNGLPGFAAGLVLGWGLPGAMALGGVTYISSSGVVARLLSDLGRTANRETPSILSVLVIEDLAMAAYLPLLTAFLLGGAAGEVLIAVAFSTGLIVLALVAARLFGEQLSAAIYDRSGEVVLLTVVGMTVLVAGLAEALHVSAAVAAFLVGIALSGATAERAEELLVPLRDLFAALFFVTIGLTTDPRQIPSVLVWAVLLGVITALTKIATGWYAAGVAGVGPRGRMRAGTALIARGEFSIVIATMAAGAGVAADILPLTATYVILLAIAGPLVTRYADRLADRLVRARGGRPTGDADRRRPQAPSWLPTWRRESVSKVPGR